MMLQYGTIRRQIESVQEEGSRSGETAADMANTLAEGNYLLYNRYVRDTDPAEVLSLYGQQRFDLAEKYLDYELIDSKDEVIASDLPEEEQEKLHEDGKEYAFRVKYIFSENGDLEDIQIGGTAFGAEEAYNMESIYINEVESVESYGQISSITTLTDVTFIYGITEENLEAYGNIIASENGEYLEYYNISYTTAFRDTLEMLSVLLIAAANGRQRAQQASAALGKLLRSYGAQDADGIYYQAEVHRAAYRACAAAMQAEQKAAAALEDAREHQCETHERLLQSLDFESGTGEAAALYQRRSALESVRTRLRTQQAQLTGAALAIGDPMALKSEHAQLLEQRAALERQYAALALAIETLGRADAELQSRFSPQLAQKAADYRDSLPGGRYDELVLARDLSAKARSADDPTPRDTAYLSAGTADLLYLSVRLALCELTCPTDDPCPLVLDDTLVNFDDARARRAMALYREIAQHRQVILFTCHERDCPAREQ